MAASYWLMRLKAATASANRVARETQPFARNSSITPSYCEAAVNTATSPQFLAADRTMAGPPISMFSMASPSVQPGLATVASKG